MRTKWFKLAKLPKSSRWTSINDKCQTAGGLDAFFPGYNPNKDPNRIGNHGDMLDPSHPSVRMRISQFPKTSTNKDVLGIQIFPMARLIYGPNPYPTIPIMTWSERVLKAREAGFSGVRTKGGVMICKGKDEKGRPIPYPGTDQIYPEDDMHTYGIPTRNATPKGRLLDLAMRKLSRRIPMSFSNATSKKRMGTFAYMRAKIAKRLRGAMQLIATRGAYAAQHADPSTGEQRSEICLDDTKAGKKWTMQGWTYIFYPTTALYRMPLPDLISVVSDSLKTVNDAARKMENTWLAESLLNYRQQPPVETPERTTTVGAKSNVLLSNVPEGNKSKLVAKSKPSEPNSALPLLARGPTGGKNPKIWKKELEMGMATLSKRLSRRNT